MLNDLDEILYLMRILFNYFLLTALLSINPVFAAIELGQTAPNIEGTLIDDKPFSLGNHKGKVVLVNFWASWCEPCREEFDELIQLQEKYGPKGLIVLAVNLAEMKPRIMQFLKGNGIAENRIEILMDRNSLIYKSWKARGIPTTFLVAKNGKIEGVWIGAIENADDDSVKNKIETLLRE